MPKYVNRKAFYLSVFGSFEMSVIRGRNTTVFSFSYQYIYIVSKHPISTFYNLMLLTKNEILSAVSVLTTMFY